MREFKKFFTFDTLSRRRLVEDQDISPFGKDTPLHGDGSARRNGHGVASEVGGKWSEETVLFLCGQLSQGRASAAFVLTLGVLLACILARSLNLSLLEPPLSCLLRADGKPHRRCAEVDGAALAAARRRKERSYPVLVSDSQRTKLVVLAGEIGGRFSEETHTFVRLLARAKTRSISEPLRTRARQSWMFRRGSLLTCAAARAFTSFTRDPLWWDNQVPHSCPVLSKKKKTFL